MKTLRQITLSLLIAATLSITAAAQSGGCIPGDTQSPPCAGLQAMSNDDETVAAATAEVTSTANDSFVTEVTVGLVETLLSIF